MGSFRLNLKPKGICDFVRTDRVSNGWPLEMMCSCSTNYPKTLQSCFQEDRKVIIILMLT